MSDPVRVVLADDHELMRLMVRGALEAEGFAVVADAADADGAVGAALEQRPDLCVLDLFMPGDGAMAARRIDNLLPGTPIVMLTASSSDDDLLRCLQAGAIGCLLKDTNLDGLPDALRRLLDEGMTLPQWLVARLLRSPRALPARDAEVLERLHRGRPAAEVARELGMPLADVRRHIVSLLRRLPDP